MSGAPLLVVGRAEGVLLSGGVPSVVRAEAHGGYLIRLESFEGLALVEMARLALEREGADPSDVSLLVSVSRRRKVVRLAYDGTATYGRRGARWHVEHPSLAQAFSRVTGLAVYAYAFDPDDGEEVMAFGDGRHVGGERIRYADEELPEDGDGELDEAAFERLKARWPLGHLSYVFGLKREELMRLPREQSVLLPLGQPFEGDAGLGLLEALLPTPQAPAQPQGATRLAG